MLIVLAQDPILVRLTLHGRKKIMNTIELVFYNPVTNEIEKRNIKYDEHTVLATMLSALGKENSQLDLSKYYPISVDYCRFSKIVPYLLVNGKISWSVDYNHLTIIDFIHTQKIDEKDNRIYLFFGIPQAGGPGLQTFNQIWQQYGDVISAAAIAYGAVKETITILKNIIGFFKAEEVQPPFPFDFVNSEDKWAAKELADKLGFSKEEAKALLKSMGYQWDRKSQRYIKTNRTSEICRRLADVDVYDR